MFCPNCGKEIPDDSRFCGFCGEVVEPESTGADVVIFDKIGEPIPREKKWPKKIIAIVAVALVVAIVVVGAFHVLGGSGSVSNANYCVWISNGEYEFVKNVLEDDLEPIELGSFSSFYNYETETMNTYLAQYTPDGKYLYYFSRMDDYYSLGTLYRVALSGLKTGSSAESDDIEKISSDVNVYRYTVLDDGTILYLQQQNSGDDIYRLCWFDGEESATIAKDVVNYVYADGVVFYSRGQDDDETYTLYGQKLEDEDSTEKIASDVDYMFYAMDSETVLYSKTTEDEDYWEVSAIYTAGYSTEAVKIADNVTNTYDEGYFAETGTFFYSKADKRTLILGDYVENPNAAADETAVEPDYDDSKYTREVEKTSWSGRTYTTTEQDYDAYSADYDDYEKAQERLELMEELQYEEYTDYVYSLYYYDAASGESTLICDQIDNSNVSIETSSSGSVAGTAYLKKADTIEKMDINAVINDEDYSYYYENADSIVSEYIQSNSVDLSTIYFTIVGGTEQSISTESLGLEVDLGYISLLLYEDGKKVAFFGCGYDDYTYDYEYSSIYSASVSGNAIGTFSELSATEPEGIAVYNDTLCYSSGEDLYIYLDGEEKLLLEDCGDTGYGVTWYTDGTILTLGDYDSFYGGTLTLVDANCKSTKVADDVSSYCALENGYILLVVDGDLRLYDGEKSERVATDVDAYWCLNEKEVTATYTYYW